MSIITKVFGTYSDRQIKKITPILKQVNALGDKYRNMSDTDIPALVLDQLIACFDLMIKRDYIVEGQQ